MRRSIAQRCLVLAAAALLGVCLTADLARATDWYVAAGAKSGKGTKDKPYKAIYKALKKAVAGDVIHVAQGEYHGKAKVGYIVIDKPGLTLVGGYKDATFGERNPFLYPTFVKESPDFKGSKFSGGYINMKRGGAPTEHAGTTIDGFWFDRKGQNSYGDGNLGLPIGSNTKPVITCEKADCHIRNCVFMNTALYAVRVLGDGSSVENCLFVNINHCGIDIHAKGKKLGKGYPYHRIQITHNTFFSIWNAISLQGGAGAAIANSGGAEVTITDNIFCLSTGNKASMGWALTDQRNFKAEPWIIFNRNSCSQLRGGMFLYYDPDQTASLGIWEDPDDLSETSMAEAEDNDRENPFFDIDKAWYLSYVSRTPAEDVSNKKVKMDDYNKMARMLGLPLQDVPRKMGKGNGAPYPLAHVRTGAFWTPKNEALKERGVQTHGPFPVTRSKIAEKLGASASASSGRDYEAVEWDALWANGDTLVGKAIQLKCYYIRWDVNYASGFGKSAKPYLSGADKTTHKILVLREIPDMDKGSPTLKGYVALGSAPAVYVQKKARRKGGRGTCNFSFVVRGVVKKAGAKINMGRGPQIVILIDSIKRR